jgi:hypothetical protein
MVKTVVEKRRFRRHPLHVPLAVRAVRDAGSCPSQSSDLSEGGLSFLWPVALPKDVPLQITIPVKEKQYEVKGYVVYSVQDEGSGFFRTGIRFVDASSAFTAKLAEESIEILDYRKKISAELGREITEEEAARRWVRKYAESFAKLF